MTNLRVQITVFFTKELPPNKDKLFYVFVAFIRLNKTDLSKFVFAFFFCRIAVTLALLKKKKNRCNTIT